MGGRPAGFQDGFALRIVGVWRVGVAREAVMARWWETWRKRRYLFPRVLLLRTQRCRIRARQNSGGVACYLIVPSALAPSRTWDGTGQGNGWVMQILGLVRCPPSRLSALRYARHDGFCGFPLWTGMPSRRDGLCEPLKGSILLICSRPYINAVARHSDQLDRRHRDQARATCSTRQPISSSPCNTPGVTSRSGWKPVHG